jgi:NADH:ubiquinone oxidoreductase subunit 3 (subunit A)
MPFSLRFFFVVILFIILDVEVCLLLQLPYDYFLGLVGRRNRFFLFVFILLLRLLVEVFVGLLN